MTFPGFPTEAIQFFASIRDHNQREWFLEHKTDFENYVQGPSQDFVVALGTRLQSIAPNLQFDTRLNGSGSIMRIYRDVRFSKDKSPYKTWQGITFWEGKNKKEAGSAVHFGFSDEGGGLHIGKYGFSKEYLTAYRYAVDRNETGNALVAALQKLPAGSTINGEKLKKVPRGFDPEHARGDLLKYKSLYVSAPNISIAQITSPELLDICTAFFENALPVHNWLVAVDH